MARRRIVAPVSPSVYRLIAIVTLALLATVGPTFALAPNATAPSVRSALVQKTDAVLEKIGEAVKVQVVRLAQHLDRNPHLQLTVDSAFYDRNLRRVFVAVHGAATFTGRLGFAVHDGDYSFTSDDAIAYDLALTRVKVSRGQITCQFSGDLVLFLDKMIYEAARDVVDVAGGLAASKLADQLLEFASGSDMKIVAEALTKTLKKFSADSLATTGAEVMDNAIRANHQKFADLIHGAVKSGGMLSFLAITIVKSSLGSVASLAGSSIGATVGNIIAPGAGGVVGAFLGGKIMGAISRTIVYEITVEIPIKVALHKIVAAHLSPNDAGHPLSPELQKSHDFILKRIKREVDTNHYKSFDGVLKAMGKFDAPDRPAFVPLLCEIKELLRFKLIDQGDWYAAKKYHQLQFWAKENGLDRWLTSALPSR